MSLWKINHSFDGEEFEVDRIKQKIVETHEFTIRDTPSKNTQTGAKHLWTAMDNLKQRVVAMMFCCAEIKKSLKNSLVGL